MKKRLLILLVFLVLISAGWFILSDTAPTGTFGINKTVGWAWDITNLIPYVIGVIFIVLLIAGIILIAGKK